MLPLPAKAYLLWRRQTQLHKLGTKYFKAYIFYCQLVLSAFFPFFNKKDAFTHSLMYTNGH